MRKHLFLVLSMACFMPWASAQTVYRVVYNETTAPLLPLVKAIYSEMGMSPVFELLPSERAISGTNSGRYDADLSRVGGVGHMYPNLVETKEPLKKTDLFAYAKKGAGISFYRIDELKNHTMGYISGSKLAEEFLNDKGFHADAVSSADSFYKMLEIGRFEIALITSTQLVSQAAEISKGAERVGPVLAANFSYHVLHKKHADLIPKFDAVLRAMKSDGRLSKYLSSYAN